MRIAIAALLLSSSTATAKPKVVVLPTQFFGESPTEVPARVFDDAVLTAVQNAGDIQVVGRDDLEAVIGLEKQKELLGCDDVACMAEIAGALDADDLVSVKVAWTEDQWTVTAKLIHLRGTSPEVTGRATEFVKGSSTDLIRATQEIVGGLFTDEPVEGVRAEDVEEEEPGWLGFGIQGGIGYGWTADSVPEAMGLQLAGSLVYRGDFEGALAWQIRGSAYLLVDSYEGVVHLELLGDATLRFGPLGPWFLGVGPFAGPLIVVKQGTFTSVREMSSFTLGLGAVVETGLMLGERKNIEVAVRGRIGTPIDFSGVIASGLFCAGYVF